MLKEHFINLSQWLTLRAKMGNKYGNVVEICLTCLDKDDVGFSDEDGRDPTSEGTF
jgi:hypothetical protein